MDTRDIYKLVRELGEDRYDTINLYDSVDIELSEGFVIETGVVGFTEDGVILHIDEDAMEFLDFNCVLLEEYRNSSDSVASAITNRITRQHADILTKFGPSAVMQAIDDVAHDLSDLDEIGSSDVSIWTKDVIRNLESGHYSENTPTPNQLWYDTSDELKEDPLNENEGTSEAVCNAILNRIARQHPDILQKFGPQAVMYAAEDLAQDYNDLDEIGSSDVSMWTKVVIQDLESGQYAHLNEAGHSEIDAFKNKLSSSSDPFQMVYDAISGNYGETIRAAIQEMYDDVVINYGFHPDDDFEKIIDKVLDSDLAEGMCEQFDELSDIKRLSGQEEVAEGLGKALAGGAALIAAIAGVTKLQADMLMKTEPQLITLTQMRQEAELKGDEREVNDIDERIRDTMDHISRTGRPVMNIDGKPLNPREPMGEAEYQGRKVPLGKPMQGDVAKSKVYVKKPDGKVVKVNFGDKNMTIKKNNPARRKSFRARHNCDNPGPRWKARYWSCRAW